MFKDQEYYSSREAAKVLHVGDVTLRNSRSTGKLSGVNTPTFIKRGRTVLYLGKTLNTWLAQFEEQAATSRRVGSEP